MRNSALPTCLGILWASLAARAEATSWIVDAAGGGDATTLQEGMFLASAGDSLLVWPGTYPGQVDLKSGVAVVGTSGPEATIVDASGPVYCLASYQEVVDVVIEGLTLTGSTCSAYGFQLPALYVHGDLEVRDCIVKENESGGLDGSGTLRVSETRFSDNGTRCLDYGAVAIAFFGQLQIEHSEFSGVEPVHVVGSGELLFVDNVAGETGPIHCSYSGSVVIERNLFHDCSWAFSVGSNTPDVVIRGNTFTGCGLHLHDPHGGWIIERNLVTGSEFGIQVQGALPAGVVFRCNDTWRNTRNWTNCPDVTGLDGNISAEPLHCDSQNGDFHVASNSPCLPANNACGVQIGAFGQGCDSVSIESSTWSQMKSAYRAERVAP